MTNISFILYFIVTLFIACVSVGLATAWVNVLLVAAVYFTLFYIGLKITTAANALLGTGIKPDSTVLYDVIFITLCSVFYGLYFGLTA